MDDCLDKTIEETSELKFQESKVHSSQFTRESNALLKLEHLLLMQIRCCKQIASGMEHLENLSAKEKPAFVNVKTWNKCRFESWGWLTINFVILGSLWIELKLCE